MSKYLDEDGVTRLWQHVTSELGGKQDYLVSGTNIKTVNGTSLLGSGNVEIQSGSSGADATIYSKDSNNEPVINGSSSLTIYDTSRNQDVWKFVFASDSPNTTLYSPNRSAFIGSSSNPIRTTITTEIDVSTIKNLGAGDNTTLNILSEGKSTAVGSTGSVVFSLGGHAPSESHTISTLKIKFSGSNMFEVSPGDTNGRWDLGDSNYPFNQLYLTANGLKASATTTDCYSQSNKVIEIVGRPVSESVSSDLLVSAGRIVTTPPKDASNSSVVHMFESHLYLGVVGALGSSPTASSHEEGVHFYTSADNTFYLEPYATIPVSYSKSLGSATSPWSHIVLGDNYTGSGLPITTDNPVGKVSTGLITVDSGVLNPAGNNVGIGQLELQVVRSWASTQTRSIICGYTGLNTCALYPKVSTSLDLGTSDNRWAALYTSNVITPKIESSTSDGEISVGSSLSPLKAELSLGDSTSTWKSVYSEKYYVHDGHGSGTPVLVGDHVVEELGPTADGWMYRKWNSGKLEIWRSHSIPFISSQSWSSWGSVFFCEGSGTMQWPVAFTALTSVNVSCMDSTASMWTTCEQSTNTNLGKIYLNSAEARDRANIVINIYAVGLWFNPPV